MKELYVFYCSYFQKGGNVLPQTHKKRPLKAIGKRMHHNGLLKGQSGVVVKALDWDLEVLFPALSQTSCLSHALHFKRRLD